MPEPEMTIEMGIYWRQEAAKLQALINDQNEVIKQSAHMNEQAAKAIKALNNKCIRLQNEIENLTRGLGAAVKIRNKLSARNPGLVIAH